jgi:hypothetical protein
LFATKTIAPHTKEKIMGSRDENKTVPRLIREKKFAWANFYDQKEQVEELSRHLMALPDLLYFTRKQRYLFYEDLYDKAMEADDTGTTVVIGFKIKKLQKRDLLNKCFMKLKSFKWSRKVTDVFEIL